MALHTSKVPVANGSISNTPIGPFHTTVFAPSNSFLKSSTVLGPMSSPIQPASIASDDTTFLLASSAKASAIMLSTGRISLSFPFSIVSSAN